MTLFRPRTLTVAVALLSVPLTLSPVLSPPAQASRSMTRGTTRRTCYRPPAR